MFGHLKHMGKEQTLRELGLYPLEGRRERGELIQALKIGKRLAEIRGHRGTIFRTSGKEKLRWNGKTTAREQVTNVLGGKSFAVQVVNGRDKLPEEVAEVGSVGEFRGKLDDV